MSAFFDFDSFKFLDVEASHTLIKVGGREKQLEKREKSESLNVTFGCKTDFYFSSCSKQQ